MRKKSVWYFVFVIFLGAFIGTLLGELLGFVLPDGVVREFFIRFAEVNVGPFDINLVLLKFTLGIALKLNIVGLLGVLLAAWILRWLD
ncbi:MAG: hypothetical protein Kow00108_19430 [Calditrichia bacterium]